MHFKFDRAYVKGRRDFKGEVELVLKIITQFIKLLLKSL